MVLFTSKVIGLNHIKNMVGGNMDKSKKRIVLNFDLD